MNVARRLLLALVALSAGFMMGQGRLAYADTARVAVVRPSSSTASATEAVNRIQGELAAEGFEVVMVDSPVDLESTVSPSPTGGSDPVASIELVVDAPQRAAQLRVVDRLTNKAVTRRTTIEADSTSRFAEVLAVRAVELLRASLIELLIRPPPRPAAVAPPVARAAAERVAANWAQKSLEIDRGSRWGVEAGGGVFAGFAGHAAVLAVFRVRFALLPSIQLRATVAGLGTASRVSSDAGSASVSQDLALAELLAVPWSGSALRPFVSLGAGALYVSAVGTTSSPNQAPPGGVSGVPAALDAGLGTELRISEHFGVSLEAHAVVAQPELYVRFLHNPVASVGEPSLLGTLTVAGWL